MPDAGSGRAAANDAAVTTDESPDPTRSLRRLEADVEQCRKVVDELGDAPAKVEAKYAKFTRGQAAELREAKRLVADAERALKAAEAALKAEEG